MAAANTDKLRKLSRKWVGQIGAGGVSDSVTTTVPLASTTNLATDTAVTIVVDRVDSAGVKTPNKEETIVGVVSGSNIVNSVRGVEGTAQAHDAGAVVEVLVTADGYNDIIDHLLVSHLQDGRLSGSVVTASNVSASAITSGTIAASAVSVGNLNFSPITASSTDTLTNKTLTSPKIGTSILDTNGNELALLTATSSAVNEITLANAATGNAPQISATGGDTNISLDLRGKGEGVTKGGIRYQSNTTNSNQNGVWIQSGWGFFVGDGDTSATESVTFPTAFTTVLSVVATGIGYKDSSDPSGIGDFGDYGVYANVNSVSTTGFNVALNIPSGSIGATRRVGYSWIAIGI